MLGGRANSRDLKSFCWVLTAPAFPSESETRSKMIAVLLQGLRVTLILTIQANDPSALTELFVNATPRRQLESFI
jgi:hypothetical protein